METWKVINGFNGDYLLNNNGVVKSIKFGKEKILKQSEDGGGYLRVTLFLNNKPKLMKIHQLLAVYFMGHTINGNTIVVDHIDGNKKNNDLSNLRLVTNRFNCSIGYVKNKENHTSNYVGVSYYKKRKKWQSTILINNKQVFLGRFNTEIEAANAYKNKLDTIIKT